MSLNRRQYVNSPVVNSRTVVLQVTLQAAPASLMGALKIAAAAASVSLAGLNGVLISASTGDVFIGGSTAGAGKGIKIAADGNLFLPVASMGLSYQCASEVSVMVFIG